MGAASARRRYGRLLAAVVATVLLATLAHAAGAPAAGAALTRVSIDGDRFLVNGEATYAGTPVEGLLLNSRMVQAAFDDENPDTVGKWAYPDTGRWDAERNTTEFVAAVPSYAASGLRAVTISMQGGSPTPGGWSSTQPWLVSAFESDGALKPAWLSRLDRAIRACDASGIVVVLTLFYFGQDERLSEEAAVVHAVDNVTDWVRAQDYGNVLIEINNEADEAYDHPILRPSRVAELIKRVRTRSGGRLKVSTSFTGGSIPPDDVIQGSDYVLVHGNGQDATGISSMLHTIRAGDAYRAAPKPIVFNEDSTKIDNLEAAVAKRASWGYYDQGQNDYVNGFQSPPVNWTISTLAKQSFFDRAASLANSAPASFDLQVSRRPDRSSPSPLEGATVADQVYAFIAAANGVARVSFFLDDVGMAGAPRQVELYAPYDFAGGSVTVANPFDTQMLVDGPHTITAAVELTTGETKVTTAAFVVDNVRELIFTLLVSTSPDRSNPTPLAGASVSGNIYAFVSADPIGIVGMRFYLDDPDASGAYFHREQFAPYDFNGGTILTANPFDTSALPTGSHTITAVAEFGAGGTETTSASFTVTQAE